MVDVDFGLADGGVRDAEDLLSFEESEKGDLESWRKMLVVFGVVRRRSVSR
jgi:hypothetical protein